MMICTGQEIELLGDNVCKPFPVQIIVIGQAGVMTCHMDNTTNRKKYWQPTDHVINISVQNWDVDVA